MCELKYSQTNEKIPTQLPALATQPILHAN